MLSYNFCLAFANEGNSNCFRIFDRTIHQVVTSTGRVNWAQVDWVSEPLSPKVLNRGIFLHLICLTVDFANRKKAVLDCLVRFLAL